MELLREHFEQHPEEYEQIAAYRRRSEAIEKERTYRREEKLKRIEECRRLLDAKHSV